MKRPQISPIRTTIKAEGAAVAAVCVYLYSQTNAGWGLFALLLLAPDVFMLGYLAGNRMGALCYNIGHSWLAPLGLAACGLMTATQMPMAIALIWGAHIGLDRALGYGLKYATGFKATHLGRL